MEKALKEVVLGRGPQLHQPGERLMNEAVWSVGPLVYMGRTGIFLFFPQLLAKGHPPTPTGPPTWPIQSDQRQSAVVMPGADALPHTVGGGGSWTGQAPLGKGRLGVI